MKELILRVTLDDCEFQTFHAGGKGGQNQNTRDTGVRIIHRASGARGESREQRTQGQNKKLAFRRMAESVVFKQWLARTIGDEDIAPSHSDEYVRTYNLVDNRVKDHRTGKQSANVKAVLNGDLDVVH